MPYSHIKFRGQTSDEVILYAAHRHVGFLFFILLRNLLYAGAGFAVMCGVVYGVMLIVEYPVNQKLIYFLVTLFGLGIINILLLTWVIWVLTLLIITKLRVMKIVQGGIFYHYSFEIKLSALQDTSYTYKNIWQNIFNYGTLIAHAASGAEGKLFIRYIGNPRDIHHYIHKLELLMKEADSSGKAVELPPFIPGSNFKRKNVKINKPAYYIPSGTKDEKENLDN